MAAAPLTFKRSEGGAEREEFCNQEFRTLLLHCAVIQMKRRGSNTLDEADFANAYKELLASRETDWTRNLLGCALLLGGGGFVSWGAGYFPRCDAVMDALMGGVLCLIGAGIGITGGFVQFWPHWKK